MSSHLRTVGLRPALKPPSLPCRLCMLLLVCAAQAWLMWRFIHSQLRHWREYWNEQSAKRRVPAAPRLPARLIKRESGECQGLRLREGEVCLGWVGSYWRLLGTPHTSLAGFSFLTTFLGLGLPDWRVAGLGPGTVWAGLALTRPGAQTTVGQGCAGWGPLAGNMSSGWFLEPSQVP